MSEEDEIIIQRLLMGNVQHVQCTTTEDEFGNRVYVYSQDVADFFQKAYEEYTEKIWEKHQRNKK